MATVLHSQLSQIQPPNSHHSHHHHHLNAQTPSANFYTAPQTQGNFFCKDCGVMFESSTSLEVHLIYHKENLMTRWGSQDSHSTTTTLEKSSSNSSSSSSLLSPSPQISHRADNNSSVDSTESTGHPTYFTPSLAPQMESSQYLPPLYNNNTGDPHHLLPSSRFAPLPIESSPGPGGLPLFHAPENFHANFHPLFSPHGHPLDPHHQAQQQGSQGLSLPPPPPPAQRETPAEILDLDSHKVHVYQHQQQQQAGFFHRPYLSHLPPVNHPNWPQEPHSPSFRFNPAAAYGNNPEPFYAPPQIQSTNGPNGNNNLSPNGPSQQPPGPPPTTYDIIRVENPAYSEIYNGNGPHSNGGAAFGQPSPYLQSQQQQPPPQTQPKQGKISPSGAVPTAPTKGQKGSPPQGPGGHNPAGPPPGVKTKGWKGGECKRPKTYNCPACNKWFTSSGHLKRHYGTTLHKNSMKNLGENAEELLKQQPKGKKAKAQAVTEKKQKAAKNNKSPPLNLPPGNNNNNSPPSDLKPPPMTFPPHHQLNGNGNGLPPLNGNGQLPKPDITVFLAPHSSPNGNGMNGGNFNPYANSPVPYGLPATMNHPIMHSPHHNVPFTTANSNFMMEFYPNHNNSAGGPNVNGNNAYGGPLPPPPDHNESGNGEGNPGNGPLPPFSSVGMSHYAGSLPPMDPYGRATPPNYHPPQQNQQISPSQNQQQQQQRNTNGNGSDGGPNFEGHFNPGEENLQAGGDQQPRRVPSPSSSMGSGDDEMQPMMDHSMSSGGSGSGSESSSGEKEVLKCPDCSKTFGRSCYLTQHVNSSHSGEENKFKCSHCGKRFPAELALSSHEAKHGAEKPYKCVQCPKQFNHKTDLRRHLCLHTGEKPFVCNHCGKGFIRKDHMTKHLETHRKKSAHPTSN